MAEEKAVVILDPKSELHFKGKNSEKERGSSPDSK